MWPKCHVTHQPTLTKDSIINNSIYLIITFNHLKWFIEIYLLHTLIKFITSNSSTGESHYIGTIQFKTPRSDRQLTTMQVSRTLYCLSSLVNLLLSRALREEGVVLDGVQDKLIHKATGQELAKIN